MEMVMGSLQKNSLGGSQHDMVKGSLQDECLQRITTVPSIGNGISLSLQNCTLFLQCLGYHIDKM